MRIGTLTLTLLLDGCASLKDKRQVIRSLIEVIRRKFNVSIAEIGDLDLWRRSVIGVACVSNDGAHANRVLDKLLDHIESRPDVEVAHVDLEIL